MNLKNILIQLHQKPIAFYPIYRDITGSLTAGLLLSQLLFWWSACNGRKFYKTDIEIMEETKLSANELRAAKSKLRKTDFVFITRKGLPAKTFYDISLVNLSNKISEFHTNKFSGIHTNKFSEFHSSYNIVQENTTENTTEKERENPLKPHFSDKQKLLIKQIGIKQFQIISKLDNAKSLSIEKKKLLIEFLEHRKDKKKPYKSEKGLKLMISKNFEKNSLEVIKTALEETIQNDWTGIFPKQPKNKEVATILEENEDFLN